MLFTVRDNGSLLWVIRNPGQYWKTNKSKWSLMLNYNIAEALLHIRSYIYLFSPQLWHAYCIKCLERYSRARSELTVTQSWPFGQHHTQPRGIKMHAADQEWCDSPLPVGAAERFSSQEELTEYVWLFSNRNLRFADIKDSKKTGKTAATCVSCCACPVVDS